MGNGANQEVYRRSRNASSTTYVAHAGRFFIILDPEVRFVEGSQSVPHPAKGFFRPYSGEQLLTDGADNLGAAVHH
jgi:hypothetical protein